jgi:large subunit ribosomal protein L6e
MGKVEKVEAGKPAAKTRTHKSRNYELRPGLMRYGKSKMFKKRALFRIAAIKKAAARSRNELPAIKKPKVKESPKLYVEKPIGGDKNGGTRKVRVKQLRSKYPTQVQRSKESRKKKTPKPMRLRKTITPGTVCIFVSTAHKGKRVVFLKQLPTSGLCLVTGPFWLNKVPLRRVHQNYLIATKTKIDVSNVKIPDHVNDEYFRRIKDKPKHKKDDGEIFESKRKKWTPPKSRKHDTLKVDKQVMESINKSGMGRFLVGYLCSKFGLQNKQYPHAMTF